MKTIFTSVLVTGLSFLTFGSFAQTKDESHTKLTEHHSKVTEHAGIIKDKETTKEEYKENAGHAGKHLEFAKKTHTELKTTMPEKHKAAAKPHHEAIEKHHAEATAHHKALNAELAKEKHDKAKVKEHAGKLHTSVTNAEAEHQKLKSKTSK